MGKSSGEGWGGEASNEMVWYGGWMASTDETLACCAEVTCPFQSPVPGVVFCKWIRRQCELPTKDIGLLEGSAVPRRGDRWDACEWASLRIWSLLGKGALSLCFTWRRKDSLQSR